MRHQRMVIDNTFFSLTAVTSGVPQGMVLDPALFLICINDIIDNIHYSKGTVYFAGTGYGNIFINLLALAVGCTGKA